MFRSPTAVGRCCQKLKYLKSSFFYLFICLLVIEIVFYWFDINSSVACICVRRMLCFHFLFRKVVEIQLGMIFSCLESGSGLPKWEIWFVESFNPHCSHHSFSCKDNTRILRIIELCVVEENILVSSSRFIRNGLLKTLRRNNLRIHATHWIQPSFIWLISCYLLDNSRFFLIFMAYVKEDDRSRHDIFRSMHFLVIFLLFSCILSPHPFTGSGEAKYLSCVVPNCRESKVFRILFSRFLRSSQYICSDEKRTAFAWSTQISYATLFFLIVSVVGFRSSEMSFIFSFLLFPLLMNRISMCFPHSGWQVRWRYFSSV